MSLMNLTDTALFKISKELINLRTYDENKITTIGSPIVDSEGTASSLSPTDGFFYDGMTITSNEIIIGIQGVFNNVEEEQCPFAITGADASSLYLLMTQTSAIVYYGGIPICSLTGINISPNLNLSIKVRISSTECEILIFNNGNLYNQTSSHIYSIDFSKYKNAYIGSFENQYWTGTIYLPAFFVSNGVSIVYTPSTEPKFDLSRVLIGDGEFPLTDSSVPLANHIYEIPVTDIIHSENIISILSRIEDDIYLNIKQIGLYDVSGESPYLFALTENININKSAELPYDLFFTVDLSLSVLNIVGFPEAGDIVMNDVGNATSDDFHNLQRIQTNCLTDLERMIKNNAMEIGYNRPQVFYKLQRDTQKAEECYSTVQNYSKLNLIFPSGNAQSLVQYYHFPQIAPNSYKTSDLCDNAHFLQVIGSSFEGNSDLIDLYNSFSLCLNANLKDVGDKIILAKRDYNDNIYFILKLENRVLKFFIYFFDTVVELKKELDIEEYASYVGQPILLTIKSNGDHNSPNVSLYKNNELLDTYTEPIGSASPITKYVLANYLSNTQDTGIYVSDIVFMNGEITSAQINYLKNLFGITD